MALVTSCLILIILAHYTTAEVKTEISIKDVLCNYEEIITPHATSYKDLVEKSRMFVDKSLLIKEFLEWNETIVMMTLPIKWGKSINADMIKNFLELPIDNRGNIVTPVSFSYNYKLFKYGELYTNGIKSRLKHRLLIAQYPDIINKHLGQYPVIMLSLESIEGYNDVDIFEQFSVLMSKVFDEHKYVLRSLKNIYDNVNETSELRRRAKSNFKVFEKILQLEEQDEGIIAESLSFLCKMLYKHFNRRVVVIINEYDLPYSRIMHTALFPQSDLKQTLKFFNKFFGVLSPDNKYLERALITGTFRFTNVPRSLTTVKDYNFITNPWPEYFGFTEDEVRHLYQRNQVTGETLERSQIWYEGYKTGENLTQRVLNPYSIASFIRVNETLPFLSNRSSVDYLHDVLNIKPMRTVFELLVNNHIVNITLNLQFCKKDTFHLKDLFFNSIEQLDKYSHDLLLSYTVASGYLGVKKVEGVDITDHVQIDIPNKELMIAICRKLMLVYFRKYGFTQSQVDKAAGNMAIFLLSCHYQPSRRFLETLQNMLDHVPPEVRANEEKLDPQNVELVYTVLNFISMKLRHMYKIHSEVFQENPITYMLTWKKNISSIVAMEFKTDSIEELLEKARERASMNYKFGHCRVQKFIAINLTGNKTAEILAGRMETEEV